MIRLFVGYDPRETAAYHVFCQSVIEHASEPLAITPLAQKHLRNFDGQRDGTNQFIFSRYLVPHLCGYQGWAIFCDGDMICRDDLANLWDLRDERYAVMVAQHAYQTRHPTKYVGSPLEARNVNYPRKNWSSVVLWNCAHPANRVLTPAYIDDTQAAVVHRFDWLQEGEIGELPLIWNWLVDEYERNADARLLHYTLGIPAFEYYEGVPDGRDWHRTLLRAVRVEGETPYKIVRRALENC